MRFLNFARDCEAILRLRRVVNVNPKNLRFQGRSTALFFSLTFSRSFFVQPFRHALQYPLACPFAFDVDVAIVCIPRETEATRFEAHRSRSSSSRFDNSGERGPPCGVPSNVSLNSPFSITPAFKNARISFNSRLSFYTTSHAAHQHVVIDAVKELFQIHIHNPCVALFQITLGASHGIMSRAMSGRKPKLLSENVSSHCREST